MSCSYLLVDVRTDYSVKQELRREERASIKVAFRYLGLRDITLLLGDLTKAHQVARNLDRRLAPTRRLKKAI